jgi:hypothetical protein
MVVVVSVDVDDDALVVLEAGFCRERIVVPSASAATTATTARARRRVRRTSSNA